MNKCQRCGKCCEDMGTIWTHSLNPLIVAIDKSLPACYYVDGGRCVMLVNDNGKASCLLELWFGYNDKPTVCKEYPFGEPCLREKENQCTRK